MTDNLLQNLEEKFLRLLAELLRLGEEINTIKQENAVLRSEQAQMAIKLQEITALLNSSQSTDSLSYTHDLATFSNTL